jgi:hypothetical protein
MAAANDLSPLQGCWDAEFSWAGRCRSFSTVMCFDERGQGRITLDIPEGIFRITTQAAYADGQLVINIDNGFDPNRNSRTSRIRVNCGPGGEEEADCTSTILEAGYCGYNTGSHPVHMKRR